MGGKVDACQRGRGQSLSLSVTLPVRGASVHISLTFSSTILQCLSNACARVHIRVGAHAGGVRALRQPDRAAVGAPADPVAALHVRAAAARPREGGQTRAHAHTRASTARLPAAGSAQQAGDGTLTRASSFRLFLQLMSTCETRRQARMPRAEEPHTQ